MRRTATTGRDRRSCSQRVLRVGSVSATALAIMWAAAVLLEASDHEDGQFTAMASATRRFHRDTQHLPAVDFERDWSNSVSGRVVDWNGAPACGASVNLYDCSDIEELLRITPPGTWPVPLPQSTTRTDGTGWYEFVGVEYGHKFLTCLGGPLASTYAKAFTHVDGTKRTINCLLPQPGDLEWQVLDDRGCPLAGIEVMIVPPIWGHAIIKRVSDWRGLFQVPDYAGTWTSTEVIVGNPRVCVTTTPGQERQIRLPARTPLNMTCEGLADGSAVLTLLPQGAEHVGLSQTRVSITRARVPEVLLWNGKYGVLLQQGSLMAWSWVEHDGTAICLESYAVTDLSVRYAGRSVPLHAAWQPLPEPERAMRPLSPLEWTETLSRVESVAAFDAEGHAHVPGISTGPGKLVVESRGASPQVVVRDSYSSEIDLSRHNSTRVVVTLGRPYLPVAVECLGSVQRGRTDRYGEAVCWCVPGPIVLHIGTEEGGWQRPNGKWAVGSEEIIEIAPERDADVDAAFVYGFVVDARRGVPCVATVSVLSSTIRPKFARTNQEGFFCVELSEDGPLTVWAEAQGTSSELRHAEVRVDGDRRTTVRVDVVIK